MSPASQRGAGFLNLCGNKSGHNENVGSGYCRVPVTEPEYVRSERPRQLRSMARETRYRVMFKSNQQWVPGPSEVAQLRIVPIRPAHEQKGGRFRAPIATEPLAFSLSLCCHASLVAVFSALLTIAIPLVISAHGQHAQGAEHDVWRDSCFLSQWPTTCKR